ncbi:MAG TPA: ferritin-like domain-containing protein [Candidatus Paceibacterota bacterium]
MAKISSKKTDDLPDLRDLFVTHLKAMLDIEEQLTKALPKMAEAATDKELKMAFTDHLEETETHVERIKSIFASLDEKPDTVECGAVRGLVKDAEWFIKKIKVGTVRDAALIAAANDVEHYEIATYSTAIEWATELGYDDVRESLEMTLSEEENAADIVMSLGRNRLNEEALGDDENTESAESDDDSGE